MVTPLQLKWFRIEQDASGAILSCEEVDAKGRKGAHVRFYEAADKASACDSAKAWYETYKAKARLYRSKPEFRQKILAKKKVFAETKRSSGLCICCGVKPLQSQWFCRECLDRRNEQARRKRAGLEPLPSRIKPADPEATRYKHLENHKQYNEKAKAARALWGSRRAHTLSRILERLDDAKTFSKFRAWLLSDIHRLGGAAAAKALVEYEAQRAESLEKASTAAYKRAAKATRRAA